MATALTAPQKRVLACLALALLGCVLPSVVYGLRAAWTDASTAAARHVVNGWRQGTLQGVSATLYADTAATLQRGIAADPDNAQLRIDLGYLSMARAHALEPFAPPGSPLAPYRLELIHQALAQYREVVRIRPRFAYGWGYLANAKSKALQADADMWAAFDQAVQWGRNEGGVQLAIAELAFAHWPALTPARRAAVDAILQSPNQEVRKDIAALAQAAGVSLQQAQAQAKAQAPTLPAPAAP